MSGHRVKQQGRRPVPRSDQVSSDLVRLGREAADGAEIAVGIVRDRKPQTLKAKLGEAAQRGRGVVVRRGIRAL